MIGARTSALVEHGRRAQQHGSTVVGCRRIVKFCGTIITKRKKRSSSLHADIATASAARAQHVRLNLRAIDKDHSSFFSVAASAAPTPNRFGGR